MRILVVEPIGHLKGHPSPYTRYLCEGIRHSGQAADLLIISSHGFVEDWPTNLGFQHIVAPKRAAVDTAARHVVVPVFGAKRSSFGGATYWAMRHAFARCSEFDVIHVLDAEWVTLWMTWVLAGRTPKLVATVPVPFPSPTNRIDNIVQSVKGYALRDLARSEIGLIVHSTAVQSWLQQVVGEKINFRTALIPWGINERSGLSSRVDARAALRLPLDGRRIFLFFGRVEPRKGIPEFLEATAGLQGRAHVMVLGPIGSEEEPARIRGAAERSGWTKDLTLGFGFIPEEQLGLYFSASDFVVLNYAKDFSGASGVLAVTAEFGLPVVATDHADLGRLVRDFGLGILFSAASQAQLRAAVEQAIGMSSGELDVLRNAVKQYRLAHSWTKIGALHLDRYREWAQTTRGRA